MAGTDDEWPILVDPNPDDEGWPLQPNSAPGPPPTEPTELRPADQPFPTYQSKSRSPRRASPASLASQVESIAGSTVVWLAVVILISLPIGYFFVPSHIIIPTWIALVVALMLCAFVAAVAEHFVKGY